MLPESDDNPKPFPLPDNWPGLSAGLEEAVVLIHKGDHDEAESLLKELGVFAPSDPRVWYLFGKIEQQRSNMERAKIFYQKAKRLRREGGSDETPPGSIRIAKLLYSQGSIEQAVEMVDELLQSRPDDMRLLRLQHRWQRER
ncbi:MAG: hypothetical protein Q9M13_00195 [Mariprofundales bacterium]|nr:hypothetical protein [Mariprofundales bacterium]